MKTLNRFGELTNAIGEAIVRLENAEPLLTQEGAVITIAHQNVAEALELLRAVHGGGHSK